jgi:hypothetical protein
MHCTVLRCSAIIYKADLQWQRNEVYLHYVCYGTGGSYVTRRIYFMELHRLLLTPSTLSKHRTSPCVPSEVLQTRLNF